MKYIKLFEEYNVSKIYPLTFWKVIGTSDGDDNEIFYEGIDEIEAKKIYDNIDSSDFNNDDKNIICIIDKYTNTYKLVDDDDDIEDYPLEEYYNSDYIYEIVEEGDYSTIKTKKIKSHNDKQKEEEIESYNSLLKDTKEYIISISDVYKNAAYMGSTFYSLVPYKDGYIQIRISDHFFKLGYVNLGRDVIWENYDGDNLNNIRKNIYGFLSIQICDSNSDIDRDKRDFKKDFIERKNNSKYPDLIQYLTYNASDDVDIIHDINNELSIIKSEINNAMNDKAFDEKYDDGDFKSITY
jgi:hypothetical protein